MNEFNQIYSNVWQPCILKLPFTKQSKRQKIQQTPIYEANTNVDEKCVDIPLGDTLLLTLRRVIARLLAFLLRLPVTGSVTVFSTLAADWSDLSAVAAGQTSNHQLIDCSTNNYIFNVFQCVNDWFVFKLCTRVQ